MHNRTVLAVVAIFCLSPNLAGAVGVLFSEDFESYAMDADVSGVGGWTISNTSAVVEPEAQWRLVDTKNTATGFGLPPTVNWGPSTTSGSSTPAYDPTGAAPGGLFMFSFTGSLPAGLFPTFPAGSTQSPLGNATYSGASNDIISPSFSTATAVGDTWLHASVTANLNNNGEAIFDVDVSTDGGTSWVNKFRRISPGSGRDVASADFDADIDVDGTDFLAMQRAFEGDTASEQRYSDWSKTFGGPYTPVVATVAAGDAGGVHGQIDVNLGNLGGATDVKVRFRNFEQRDDIYIAIDNIVVDDFPKAGSASVPIYLEDFNDLNLGLNTMGVYEFVHLGGLFGTDTGDGGSISGFSWGAQDRSTIDYVDAGLPTQGPPVLNTTGRYDVGVVGSKNVNHLGHPTAEGANGEVPFAIIDPKSEPEVPGGFGSIQSERLHTPILDLTAYDTVILEWDDETIFAGNPFNGSVASVVLMVDDGDGIPNAADTVLNEPDKFGNDFFDPYLPYDQFAGGMFLGSRDPIFASRRIDISAEAAGRDDLYIAFQFVSSRTDFWAIDNVRITGELAPAAASVSTPEPTSLLLALVGIPTLAFARRRVRTR